ncbi:MAG: type III secretion system chaperone [Pseudomonadota bacterium]
MFEDHALVADLRETLGLALAIDDEGRSVISDNAGGEIGIFFRRDGAQVHLCAAVRHVEMADPSPLYQALLQANLTNSIEHDFYFGLDRDGHQVMIFSELDAEDLSASTFVDVLEAFASCRDSLRHDLESALGLTSPGADSAQQPHTMHV